MISYHDFLIAISIHESLYDMQTMNNHEIRSENC